MRKVVFRGKRVDTQEWTFGSLVKCYNGRMGIVSMTKYCEENGIEALIDEVLLETVGQYTGLKDKCGNDIWEGDVLSIVYRDGINYGDDICEDCYGTGVVEYNEYTGCFEIHIIEGDGYVMNNICYNDDFTLTFYSIVIKETRVVGNVFDNPELLKGGEE